MGERLLCKQEVVGSIPSGSTSRVEATSLCACIHSSMIWFRTVSFAAGPTARCVLSDIVKRGLIRALVWGDPHAMRLNVGCA